MVPHSHMSPRVPTCGPGLYGVPSGDSRNTRTPILTHTKLVTFTVSGRQSPGTSTVGPLPKTHP